MLVRGYYILVRYRSYLQTVANRLSVTFRRLRMNVLFISCAHAHTNYRISVVGSSALIAFWGNEQVGSKFAESMRFY